MVQWSIAIGLIGSNWKSSSASIPANKVRNVPPVRAIGVVQRLFLTGDVAVVEGFLGAPEVGTSPGRRRALDRAAR